MKVAIIGAGQLAQMLAQAGKPLGLHCRFLSPEADSCAAPFGELICADYDDPKALAELIEWADIITYEFENIPAPVIAQLEKHKPLYPPSTALKVASDRLKEKALFQALGIATAQYQGVNSIEDLENAVGKVSLPAILKTRTLGYDGKGQYRLKTTADIPKAWHAVGQVPAILEALVEFDGELSIIAARGGTNGQIICYPLSQNHHRDGILRLSTSHLEHPLQAQAEQLIKKLIDALDYKGVITLELFNVKEKLIANEIAPRVHNSGHWTLDGCNVSQFENHLRAVCGLDLVQPKLTKTSAMVNLIGTIPKTLSPLLNEKTKLYAYGKSERPGRKLGHINVIAGDEKSIEFRQNIQQLLNLVGETELATNLHLADL